MNNKNSSLFSHRVYSLYAPYSTVHILAFCFLRTCEASLITRLILSVRKQLQRSLFRVCILTLFLSWVLPFLQSFLHRSSNCAGLSLFSSPSSRICHFSCLFNSVRLCDSKLSTVLHDFFLPFYFLLSLRSRAPSRHGVCLLYIYY